MAGRKSLTRQGHSRTSSVNPRNNMKRMVKRLERVGKRREGCVVMRRGRERQRRRIKVVPGTMPRASGIFFDSVGVPRLPMSRLGEDENNGSC